MGYSDPTSRASIQNVLKMHVLLESQKMTSAKLNNHLNIHGCTLLKESQSLRFSVCLELKVYSQWPYNFLSK